MIERLIIDNPFTKKVLLSYGIIAYCPSTERWLLVQRRYSPEFIFFIRGLYRHVDLYRMVEGFSREECQLVLDLINEKRHFRELYYDVIFDYNINYEHSYVRYETAKGLLGKLLKLKSSMIDCEWLWPKGRLRKGTESCLGCAIREFEEETGLKLPNKYPSFDDVLSESVEGFTGYTYETKCWIYLFDEEPSPPPPGKHGEIAQRKWVSFREAEGMLRDNKKEVLHAAKEILDKSTV